MKCLYCENEHIYYVQSFSKNGITIGYGLCWEHRGLRRQANECTREQLIGLGIEQLSGMEAVMTWLSSHSILMRKANAMGILGEARYKKKNTIFNLVAGNFNLTTQNKGE